MTDFAAMGLPKPLLTTLQSLGFKTPTPIQQAAIPMALQGRDILGTAQTGTGKTGAFGLPLAARLLSDRASSALVITPTRELAKQVCTDLKAMLGQKSGIRSALLIGGDAMHKQINQLRNQPHLVVGTPGRINDHLKRRSLDLSGTDFLVLDETDRMLDMGFSVQIETILEAMPPARQTLLFTATLPKKIEGIAHRYLSDPKRVAVDATSSPAANITQENKRLSDADKYPTLLEELGHREGSVVLFVKTKYNTEKMARRLEKAGHSAEAIHGDLRQSKRDRVITAFRNQKFRILVATDVAARGLDIPHISHVINYDLPHCAEDYIHRIGRTARAGAKGSALNLIVPSDKRKWAAIEKILFPKGGKQAGSENSGMEEGGHRKSKPHKASFKGRNQKQGTHKPGKQTQGKQNWGKPRRGKAGLGKPASGAKPAGSSGLEAEKKTTERDGAKTAQKPTKAARYKKQTKAGKSVKGQPFAGKRQKPKSGGKPGGRPHGAKKALPAAA